MEFPPPPFEVGVAFFEILKGLEGVFTFLSPPQFSVGNP
jgi:hypothetical protein